MIYGAYHFPTGKWYVGQTVNTIRQRAREHWYARKSARDFLHLALADDPDPMTWLALPLEIIPKELWRCPEADRQAGWRKKERALFRAVATPREKYWVDKLRSMWPKGWNSAYPGKPASAGHLPPSGATAPREPARDLEAAKSAIRQWQADPRATRRWLHVLAREDLVEILEGLEKGLRPTEQTATTAAIAAEAREALRKRKAEKKARDFVRFLYGHPIAEKMALPDIIRDPEVYKLHPEPEVGAAIMVVHKFAPQIASALFNYKDWAMHPQPMDADGEEHCPCRTQVRPNATLVEGHVLSTDPDELASPYLREILSKGKKYRLRLPISSVLARLEDGLRQYVEYKTKAHQDDEGYRTGLLKWAEAVRARAEARITQAAREHPHEPDGYPNLQEQLSAAKRALVFGPEDRAPHALFFACGRLFAAKLHERLEATGAFVPDARPPADLLEQIKALNDELQLLHHPRLPYLYGAWKAKKQAFRWIAGTARNQDEGDHEEEEGKPKNALSEVGGLMVKVLQVVMATLRRKDREAVGKGNKSRYWIIEDIDEFVQEFRVLAQSRALGAVPWATYDFTTMYEALEHEHLVHGVMAAVKEAWEEETTGKARDTGQHPRDVDLRLGAGGWHEAAKVKDAPGMPWFTLPRVEDTLRKMLANLYAVNGGVVRKQQKGVPMGLECSPQLANLYAYAVESRWVDRTAPTNVLMRRYIDDIIVMGPDALTPGKGLPTEEDYGMQYKSTAEEPHSLIYLGVRLFVDDRGQAHSVLHDRAVDYPIRVDRYPEGTTVANPAQLAGVIMGRLVAAQRTCSRMDLFQDAVAGIFTHAHRRGYPRRMVHSTWTRFLWRYWDAASVTTRELRAWFHDAWRKVTEVEEGGQRRPAPKWPTWEARVPLPRDSGRGTPQHPLPRDAAGHQAACEGTPQPQAAQREPIDDLIDLTTPPGSPPHASQGDGEPQGGSSQPASSYRPMAPPLIPYPLPPSGRGGVGPTRTGRPGQRGAGQKGNIPPRRPWSSPVYPTRGAASSSSTWAEKAVRWGCPPSESLPLHAPLAQERAVGGALSPRAQPPHVPVAETRCTASTQEREVAGASPTPTTQTSAATPTSQQPPTTTVQQPLQVVQVPQPYPVPVPVPTPCPVPVYVERVVPVQIPVPYHVPVPVVVERAVPTPYPVPVHVERLVPVERPLPLPWLDTGAVTALLRGASAQLPMPVQRLIQAVSSTTGPTRARWQREMGRPQPYPAEGAVDPQRALLVEMVRWIWQQQQQQQESRPLTHRATLAIEDAPTAATPTSPAAGTTPAGAAPPPSNNPPPPATEGASTTATPAAPPGSTSPAPAAAAASSTPAPPTPTTSATPPPSATPTQEAQSTTATEEAPARSDPMATDRLLGNKRPVSVVVEEAATPQPTEGDDASQATQPSQRKKRLYTRLAEWPAEWREQYERFKATPKASDRHEMWQGWDQSLQDQVWAAVADKRRDEIRRWKARENEGPPTQAEGQASSTREERRRSHTGAEEEGGEPTSHDWQEGQRIGEAKQPGPEEEGSAADPPEGQAGSPKNHPRPAWGGSPGVPADHRQGVSRHAVNRDPNKTEPTRTMTQKITGMPGNDGLPGAEDLCPGWQAGRQPKNPQPTWGGSPGVPANHWQGVARHAVKRDEGAEEPCPRSRSQDQHDWKKGARIGEAKNPGPPQRGYQQPNPKGGAQRGGQQTGKGQTQPRKGGKGGKGNVTPQGSRQGQPQGEGWQTAQSTGRKRLQKRLQGLQRALQEMQQELDQWRQNPPPQQQQQRPDLRDDNPWAPLQPQQQRRERKRSIGFESPSRQASRQPPEQRGGRGGRGGRGRGRGDGAQDRHGHGDPRNPRAGHGTCQPCPSCGYQNEVYHADGALGGGGLAGGGIPGPPGPGAGSGGGVKGVRSPWGERRPPSTHARTGTATHPPAGKGGGRGKGQPSAPDRRAATGGPEAKGGGRGKGKGK
eukprot:EG_transcript_109